MSDRRANDDVVLPEPGKDWPPEAVKSYRRLAEPLLIALAAQRKLGPEKMKAIGAEPISDDKAKALLADLHKAVSDDVANGAWRTRT